MENHSKVFIAAVSCVAAIMVSAVVTAAEQSQADLSWLDLLDQSYGPTESRCGLGFVGFGSPIVVTRVSSWTQAEGLAEADRVLAVNGNTVRNDSDLSAATKLLQSEEQVMLSVLRDGDIIRVRTACQDVKSVLQARANALEGAAKGRWQDCIGATYEEEFHWGGATSESAGLRLWCHQAQSDQNILTRLDAQFLYEHTRLLLDEYRFVPGWIRSNRAGFVDRIEKISAGGHKALSAELQAKLERID